MEINFEQLKQMTIGEALKLADDVKNFPEGFVVTYQKPEEVKSAQEVLDSLDLD